MFFKSYKMIIKISTKSKKAKKQKKKKKEKRLAQTAIL
jgi:hypothetical protein